MTARSENQHDAALVAACLQGDKAAFGTLVTRHLTRVQRVVGSRLAGTLFVDDVVQDAFLQAYLNLAKLREPQHFGAWVCGIATNLARMRGRSRRETVDWDELQLPSDQIVETTVEKREQLRGVYAAIDQLPSAERAAIWHVYRDGMSLRETATRLDISLSAAKVRVHRGRKRLRQQFMEQKMIAVNIHEFGYLSDSEDEGVRPIRLTDYLAVRSRYFAWRNEKSVGKHKGEKMPLELQQFSNLVRAAIVLQEQGSKSGLPIGVGQQEFEQLAWATVGKSVPNNMRPLTVDLLETLLEAGGVRIVQMAVSKWHQHIFYGTLTIETDAGRKEIDCRPSDGILLALRKEVPIFVDEAVMEAVTTRIGKLSAADNRFVTLEW